MARPLTYRRHGRHSRYDRVERRIRNQLVPGLKQDTRRFVDQEQARLDTAEGAEGVFDAMMLVQEEDESFTFEEVRDAADPTSIGLTPSFQAQTFSLDYSGFEFMQQSGASLIGIANTWTLVGWFKIVDVTTSSGTLFFIEPPAGSVNKITVFHRHAGPTGPRGLQLFIADSGGVTLQNVSWQNRLNAGVWHHIVIQWDGTLPGRKFFLDGVDQGAIDFSSGNSPGTLTDTTRQVSIAQASTGVGNLAGRSAYLAAYNSILSPAEITALYNLGSINFNLGADSGAYASSGNLAHWWETGKQVSPNLGADAGLATPIDIEAGATGIDDTDRVADVP